MFSLNKWVVKGKVVEVSEKQKGYWITVKGVAENPTIFNSDLFRIKCWISKRIIGSKKPKGYVSMSGSFQFRKQDCYLIADRID